MTSFSGRKHFAEMLYSELISHSQTFDEMFILNSKCHCCNFHWHPIYVAVSKEYSTHAHTHYVLDA